MGQSCKRNPQRRNKGTLWSHPILSLHQTLEHQQEISTHGCQYTFKVRLCFGPCPREILPVKNVWQASQLLMRLPKKLFLTFIMLVLAYTNYEQSTKNPVFQSQLKWSNIPLLEQWPLWHQVVIMGGRGSFGLIFKVKHVGEVCLRDFQAERCCWCPYTIK